MQLSQNSRGITLGLVLALLITAGACRYPDTVPPEVVPPAPGSGVIQEPPPPPPPPPPPTATRCDRGNPDKGAPMICVDADKAGFPPDPYVAKVWDLEKGSNGKGDPNRPVRVLWVASRGSLLNVQILPDAAGELCTMSQPNCEQGQCTAVVKKMPDGSGENDVRVCKYHVWIDNTMGEASSPELRVNPCCW